jgi:hypothetical protein
MFPLFRKVKRDIDFRKTIRRVTDPEGQEMETYRYWQKQSVGNRLTAVRDVGKVQILPQILSKKVCPVFGLEGTKQLSVHSSQKILSLGSMSTQAQSVLASNTLDIHTHSFLLLLLDFDQVLSRIATTAVRQRRCLIVCLQIGPRLGRAACM